MYIVRVHGYDKVKKNESLEKTNTLQCEADAWREMGMRWTIHSEINRWADVAHPGLVAVYE